MELSSDFGIELSSSCSVVVVVVVVLSKSAGVVGVVVVLSSKSVVGGGGVGIVGISMFVVVVAVPFSISSASLFTCTSLFTLYLLCLKVEFKHCFVRNIGR